MSKINQTKENKCQYCGHLFQTKNSLKIHQSKAEYCKKIQRENKVQCLCGKLLESDNNLLDHQENCVIYIRDDYEKQLLKKIRNYSKR